MVDFGELKGKADELLSQHADQAKTGLGKAGDLAGDRFGHEKVDPLEDKATGYIDGLGHSDPPAEQPTP